MIINETRRAIIELIEPYMNKTLSKWCLYQFQNETIEEITNSYSIFDLSAIIEGREAWDTEIIWHYDITAVLKFFHTKIPRNYPWECWILLQRQWFVDDVKFSIPFRKNSKKYIPNKPLYLYTEEEDKQLLELLLKLK